MSLVKQLLARRRGGVSCRDERGFRESLVPVPRPNGEGVDLVTPAGRFRLRPLEVGQLCERLREANIASDSTTDAATDTTSDGRSDR